MVLEAIGSELTNGFAKPIDVLSLQEQYSSVTTTQDIVDLLNGIYGLGIYNRATLDGTTAGAGRPGLIYNTSTVSMIDQIAFGTVDTSAQARQTLRYQLRPVGYDASADFYVYSNHYKAGSSGDDKDRRQVEAAALRADADALGEGVHAIYSGDFNIRSSSEQSYQTLLASGNGQAFDPISTPGTWHDSSSFKIVHSQAPAVSPPGLIGGGVDDRFCFAQLARAEITWSGDINPANPTTWKSSTYAYIGKTGSGSVTVDGDSDLLSRYGNIGYESGSTGEVTVDGTGSTWTSSDKLTIGNYGSGTLSITGGGEVTVEPSTWVSRRSGSAGAIHFDQGTLTTGGLFVAIDDLTGTGMINTNGLVSDVDLVFDATHGLNQTFSITDNPGQNIAVHLDVNGSSSMGAGYGGVGTMNISDGIVIESNYGYIGYKSGSSGEVAVFGADSTWNSGFNLDVGYSGNGTLNVTSGGALSSYRANIGFISGSTGEVMVDGSGSTWTNNSTLHVGYRGSGTLNVTGGGVVNCYYDARIGSYSDSTGEVTIDGADSTWIVSKYLSVGHIGSGTLNISDGGAVTVGKNTGISGSAGTIHFDRGTLTTGGLSAASDDLTGTGTINTNGLVSDVDLVFDATHGLNQTFSITDNPGQNLTVNLDVNGSGSMGAGYGGVGTMSISDEIVIESISGLIGYLSGSTGEVTVDGAGSMWNSSSSILNVGIFGNGILNITGGAVVNCNNPTYTGRYTGSMGEVTVDGVNSAWNINSDIYVGDSGSGMLNITGGGFVGIVGHYSHDAHIGEEAGSMGEVTVDGADSMWTISANLDVGNSGNGTLNITGGGEVTVGGNTWLSSQSGVGAIHFDQGTLTTGGLLAASDDLTGTGTINTNGLVSDVDLVFDATHGLNQTFSISDNPGQNITVHLDANGSSIMGAGYGGVGTMSISDGIVIESNYGYIGFKSGSSGEVTVAGAASTWNSMVKLYIGSYGSGTLNITDGGAVNSNFTAHIGFFSGSTGEVRVNGTGSIWTNRGTLYSSGDVYVGGSGSGTLHVTNNGMVDVDSEDLIIGLSGNGSMSITSGGAVRNNGATIGRSSDSMGAVLVDGAGSSWNSNENFYVGDFGSGMLSVTSGGAVSNGTSYIGHESGSTGVVTVDGSSSTWANSDNLYAGHSGSGTLNVMGGGAVSSGTSYIGYMQQSTRAGTVFAAASALGGVQRGCPASPHFSHPSATRRDA